jgi:hypothetical protein
MCRSLAENATAFAGDFTIRQLQQVLAERGVPKSQTKRLRKCDLIVRIQAGEAAQRVATALNVRAATQEQMQHQHHINAFSQLGSQLVLEIAECLDLPSVARLSRISRFLRSRLTLSFAGTPSPVFVARKRLRLQAEHAHVVHKVLVRTTQLQYLELQDPKVLPPLPPSLLSFHGRSNGSSVCRWIEALGRCSQLRELRLANLLEPLNGSKDHLAMMSFLAATTWLHLRQLCLVDCESDIIAGFAHASPALEQLSIQNCLLGYMVGPVSLFDLRLPPSLSTLEVRGYFIGCASLASSTGLRHLHFSSATTMLLNWLTEIHAKNLVLPELESLTLSCSGFEFSSFRDLFEEMAQTLAGQAVPKVTHVTIRFGKSNLAAHIKTSIRQCAQKLLKVRPHATVTVLTDDGIQPPTTIFPKP